MEENKNSAASCRKGNGLRIFYFEDEHDTIIEEFD